MATHSSPRGFRPSVSYGPSRQRQIGGKVDQNGNRMPDPANAQNNRTMGMTPENRWRAAFPIAGQVSAPAAAVAAPSEGSGMQAGITRFRDGKTAAPTAPEPAALSGRSAIPWTGPSLAEHGYGQARGDVVTRPAPTSADIAPKGSGPSGRVMNDADAAANMAQTRALTGGGKVAYVPPETPGAGKDAPFRGSTGREIADFRGGRDTATMDAADAATKKGALTGAPVQTPYGLASSRPQLPGEGVGSPIALRGDTGVGHLSAPAPVKEDRTDFFAGLKDQPAPTTVSGATVPPPPNNGQESTRPPIALPPVAQPSPSTSAGPGAAMQNEFNALKNWLKPAPQPWRQNYDAQGNPSPDPSHPELDASGKPLSVAPTPPPTPQGTTSLPTAPPKAPVPTAASANEEEDPYKRFKSAMMPANPSSTIPGQSMMSPRRQNEAYA